MTESPGRDFSTPDLYLAASLVAVGEPLVGVDRRGPRAWFVFARTERTEALLLAYAGGSLVVGARAMADAVRGLKQLLAANPGVLR